MYGNTFGKRIKFSLISQSHTPNMQFQSFLFYKICVFLIVFFCLPLPHGNIYPFLVLIGACVFQFKKRKFQYKRTDLLVYALIAWSALSIFWAIDVLKALQMYVKVGLLMLAGWFWWNRYSQFAQREHQQFQRVVFGAGCLLAVSLIIFGIDARFKGGLHSIIDEHISQALVHGCVACSLAIWINLQHWTKWFQGGVLILLFWIMHYCSSDAASLGILLGAVTLVTCKFFPRFLKSMFIYGMPAVWAGLPFVFRVFSPDQYVQLAKTLDPSYTHRLFIWHSVTKQIFERFWTGFGFGSSRYRSLFIQGEDIILLEGAEKLVLSAPENCLHPHNFMLQVWFELGAIGVVLICLTWITYWKKQYEKTNCYTIAFWGSVLCVAATGISIWQSWWLVLLVVLTPVYSSHISNNS